MQGFASGALGSLAGSGFQELGGNFAKSAAGTIGFSAVAGGVGAELTGGEFWKGATTGAIVAGLNHVAKHGLGPKPKPKSNFYKSFMNAKESDHFSMSAKTGYVGTGVSAGSALNKAYRHMPRTTFSGMRDIVRTGKFLGKVGNGIGGLGTAIKSIEAFSDGNLTLGEGVVIGISAVSIVIPAVGIIDLGVEMTTGTSLSDRIAAGIDATYP